jgi:hypothetical protein
MPTGLVIAALMVIGLVVFVTLFIFDDSSENAPSTGDMAGPERAGE